MKGKSIESIFGQSPDLISFFKDPSKLKLLHQLAREGSMKPIFWADQATTVSLWLGAYRSQLAKDSNVDSAIAYADKAIRRTQPQSGMVHLPGMFRSTPTLKMLTIFRNQPNQNFNLMYDTVVKYGKGKKI
jgi:hypothetical protein